MVELKILFIMDSDATDCKKDFEY